MGVEDNGGIGGWSLLQETLDVGARVNLVAVVLGDQKPDDLKEKHGNACTVFFAAE